MHEYEVKKFPRAHNTGAVSHRPSDKAGIIVLGRRNRFHHRNTAYGDAVSKSFYYLWLYG